MLSSALRVWKLSVHDTVSMHSPDEYKRASYYNGITGDGDQSDLSTVWTSSLCPSPSLSADMPISPSSHSAESSTPHSMLSKTLLVPRFVTCSRLRKLTGCPLTLPASSPMHLQKSLRLPPSARCLLGQNSYTFWRSIRLLELDQFCGNEIFCLIAVFTPVNCSQVCCTLSFFVPKSHLEHTCKDVLWAV